MVQKKVKWCDVGKGGQKMGVEQVTGAMFVCGYDGNYIQQGTVQRGLTIDMWSHSKDFKTQEFTE